jgi:hypothetical protein
LSAWSKTGLRPLNPDKVLKDIPKPDHPSVPVTLDAEVEHDNIAQLEQLETPTTSESLMALRKKIDGTIAQGGELERSCILQIQKLANAAENAFADRAILLDENLLLFEQNRKSPTQVLGKRSRNQELEVAEQEIRSLGREEYCSMLRF